MGRPGRRDTGAKLTTRQYGTGGAIKEISPGLFHAQPSIGGRRYSVSAPTKAGVVKGIRKLHADVEAKGAAAGSSMTVEAYLTAWLRDTAKPSVRHSTFTIYERNVRLYLIPRLGRLRLDALKPEHVDALLAALGRETKLSPRGRQMVRDVLRGALQRAVRRGQLTRNAASYSDPIKVARKSVVPWTPKEARAILAAASDRGPSGLDSPRGEYGWHCESGLAHYRRTASPLGFPTRRLVKRSVFKLCQSLLCREWRVGVGEARNNIVRSEQHGARDVALAGEIAVECRQGNPAVEFFGQFGGEFLLCHVEDAAVVPPPITAAYCCVRIYTLPHVACVCQFH